MSSYSRRERPVNRQIEPIEPRALTPQQPAQAAAASPKPIHIAYVRSDDGADMIEIGPYQAASLDALLARRLMPSAIKAVGAA